MKGGVLRQEACHEFDASVEAQSETLLKELASEQAGMQMRA